MSIEAIEAISRYIDKREKGISISEIQMRIRLFVEQRDKNEAYNARQRYGGVRGKTDSVNFYMRNGIRIERGSK